MASPVLCPEELHEVVASGSLDFDSWASLISEIEKIYSDNIEVISLLYESFLSKFPLCNGYWKKYADHKARLCSTEKATEIFERAVQSATYSVGVWVDYTSFSMLAYEEPHNIHRVFERGLSYVGKDFLCHSLWDMYIKFEFCQHKWDSLAHILIRALKFPTKKLHHYYDNFKKFGAFLEEEMTGQEHFNLQLLPEGPSDIAAMMSEVEINQVMKDLQISCNGNMRSEALNKYIAIGEQFYRKACKLHEKIECFENLIQPTAFLVTPLDNSQLENWHNYLDFIEQQDDFDWAVKLYERCLISCANYPEFWMRYVEFMESKGGREIANFVLDRATKLFLKNVPDMHIFNARFKERIGDVDGARAAYLLCGAESDSSLVEIAVKEANMEKRLGNLAAACDVFDRALKLAGKQQNFHSIPVLYVHLYRLKYLITGSVDAATDIIVDGIRSMPNCRLLLEELINFAMMHGGSRHLNIVDPIIATAITCVPDGSECLPSKDREELSCLYLEFVDLCGTYHDVKRAWDRHLKLFPHLVRNITSHALTPRSVNTLLNAVIEGKQRNPLCIESQPSYGSYHLNQMSTREQGQVMLQSYAMHNQDMPHQSEPLVGKYCGRETMQHSSHHVSQCIGRKAEDANHTGDVVPELELAEFSQDLDQQRDDEPSLAAASKPIESTIEFKHSESLTAPAEASLKYANPICIQQEHEQQHHEPQSDMQEREPEMHRNPDICTSLNPQLMESQDLATTILEDIVSQNMLHENPPTISAAHSPTTDGAEKEGELDEYESRSLSCHHSLILDQEHPKLEVPSNSAEISIEMNVTLSTSGSVSVESHGHSPSQQQFRQEQAFPRGECSTSHMGDRMLVDHHYKGTITQRNVTSHAWPVPTMPLQGSVSLSQPAYSYPEAQAYMYPIHTNELLGHVHHTHLYNQMMQYYAQEQYQQQLTQMQQPYLGPQNQLQYLQAFSQQQHLQQQQQLQIQPQQLQQHLQQQYGIYQQQEQYQPYQKGYEVLVQQSQPEKDQEFEQLTKHHQQHQQ